MDSIMRGVYQTIGKSLRGSAFEFSDITGSAASGMPTNTGLDNYYHIW